MILYNDNAEYKRIVLWGCGGHARSIANVLIKDEHSSAILFVDEKAQSDESIYGYRVKKPEDYVVQSGDVYFFASGDATLRERLFGKLGEKENSLITIVSDSAEVSKYAMIGKGVFVGAYAYIGPEAIIGDNSIINSGSIVEHEVVIGKYSHIAPGSVVCGRTKIGERVLVGAGATIVDNVSVCDNVTIGAGATVIEDIIQPGIYVGSPAKRIK